MMGGLTDARSTPALAFVAILSLSCVLSGVVSSWLPTPLVIAVVGMAAATAGLGLEPAFVGARVMRDAHVDRGRIRFGPFPTAFAS